MSAGLSEGQKARFKREVRSLVTSASALAASVGTPELVGEAKAFVQHTKDVNSFLSGLGFAEKGALADARVKLASAIKEFLDLVKRKHADGVPEAPAKQSISQRLDGVKMAVAGVARALAGPAGKSPRQPVKARASVMWRTLQKKTEGIQKQKARAAKTVPSKSPRSPRLTPDSGMATIKRAYLEKKNSTEGVGEIGAAGQQSAPMRPPQKSLPVPQESDDSAEEASAAGRNSNIAAAALDTDNSNVSGQSGQRGSGASRRGTGWARAREPSALNPQVQKERDLLRLKVQHLEAELRSLRNPSLTLTIIFHKAEGLSAADANGLSDPFCVVNDLFTVEGEPIQTTVMEKTLNPVWHESFRIRLSNREGWAFRVNIWDFDLVGKNDFLGYVDVRSNNWKLSPMGDRRWLNVVDGQGRIQIELRSDDSSLAPNESNYCNCCESMSIPDSFYCADCSLKACVLCMVELKCHICQQRANGTPDPTCPRSPEAMELEKLASGSDPHEQRMIEAKVSAQPADRHMWKSYDYVWGQFDNSAPRSSLKNAGSFNAAETPLIQEAKGYGLEYGRTGEVLPGALDVRMADPWEQYPYYTRHMMCYAHAMLIGFAKQGNKQVPLIVTVEKPSAENLANNSMLALVFSPMHTLRKKLFASKEESDEEGYLASDLKVSGGSNELFTYLRETYPLDTAFRRVPSGPVFNELSYKLLDFERVHMDTNRRVGVLLYRSGQTENEAFSNSTTPDFREFFEFLGERVKLLGWNKYAGGLNTKNGSTGEDSIYTEFNGFNIMAHISTLLPRDEAGSDQQLARKRFIGNDLVVFVFKDADESGDRSVPFDPTMITSQMCHVFIVVEKVPHSSPTEYRICITTKPGVPAFPPYLPQQDTFAKGEKLRNFLLAKALNGNRAAFKAPTFKRKVKHTKTELLTRMINDANEVLGEPSKRSSKLLRLDSISPGASPQVIRGLVCTEHVQVRALEDHVAVDENDLSFREGDRITVVAWRPFLSPSHEHMVGLLNDRVGLVPIKKVERKGAGRRAQRGPSLLPRLGSNSDLSSKGARQAPSRANKSARRLPGLTRVASAGAIAGGTPYTLGILAGRDMKACDSWGTSDPYAVIVGLTDAKGRKMKTKVVKRTLNPTWNEEFSVHLPEKYSLHVQFFDQDVIGKDDFMGSVDVTHAAWGTLKRGEQKTKWLPVRDGEGEVQISLKKL